MSEALGECWYQYLDQKPYLKGQSYMYFDSLLQIHVAWHWPKFTSWISFYDTHIARIMFWRKVVVRPFLWSIHDFISPRNPFEQILQSSGFRPNIWNWLCCSLSVHVLISATDTSNALCKIHLQKNDAFTVASITELHDCFSRISVREKPKLYKLTYTMYYLYFVYKEETFVFHYWCVSEIGCSTSHSTIFSYICDGT